MEDKTNVIKIQRYHSPCGDLMLGSLEDKLCLCDWAAESHRDIVDRSYGCGKCQMGCRFAVKKMCL